MWWTQHESAREKRNKHQGGAVTRRGDRTGWEVRTEKGTVVIVSDNGGVMPCSGHGRLFTLRA